MTEQHASDDPGRDAEELLRRALIDPEGAAAVALRIDGLTMTRTLTVIFHGRRDLSTVETFVANGDRGAGSAVKAAELLRVPCDLDLHDAHDRDEASELYAAQARALRDALLAADAVLGVWHDTLTAMGDTPLTVDRSITLDVTLPAHRLMPVALVAPEKHLTVAPVCSARTLAQGLPPMGIALAQSEVSHVYPLPDDPERCLNDFAERSAAHARGLAAHLERQETSVERFLELSLEEDEPTLN